MNVKQFKRRWLNSKVEPELFYLPCGKRQKSADYIQLQFKELIYSNYYETLGEYPEYTDQILKLNKYQNGLLCSINSEAIFYNVKYTPLFKVKINNGLITIRNIPYGTYHIKIIKGVGYTLQEYTIVVNESNNRKCFVLELVRSYMKVEIGTEDRENPTKIYEVNEYMEKVLPHNPWVVAHLLSCEASGCIYYKVYTYDNIYLGKVILGFALYDPNGYSVGGCSSGYGFQYFPTRIISEKHIPGNAYSGNHAKLLTEVVSTTFSYHEEDITGGNSYINIPHLNKISIGGVLSIENRITYESDGTEFMNNTTSISCYSLFERQQEIYMNVLKDDGSLEEKFAGYRFYFEDGMTSEIYNQIASGVPNSRCYPSFLAIDKGGQLISLYRRMYISENWKLPYDTMCYYNNYPIFSNDYSNYNSFEICDNYDFNK